MIPANSSPGNNTENHAVRKFFSLAKTKIASNESYLTGSFSLPEKMDCHSITWKNITKYPVKK
jgi:hypothetical protein